MMLLLIHVDVAHIESAQNLHEEDENGGEKQKKNGEKKRKSTRISYLMRSHADFWLACTFSPVCTAQSNNLITMLC